MSLFLHRGLGKARVLEPAGCYFDRDEEATVGHAPYDSMLHVDPALLARADNIAEHWVTRDMREATGGEGSLLLSLNPMVGALDDHA